MFARVGTRWGNVPSSLSIIVMFSGRYPYFSTESPAMSISTTRGANNLSVNNSDINSPINNFRISFVSSRAPERGVL